MWFRKIHLCVLIVLLLGTNVLALDQKDGVYQIATAEDLVGFSELVNGGEIIATAVLTADIDMAAESVNFLPIGTEVHMFSGVFDGQGHCIKNLNISLTQPRVGVFGVIQSPAVIKNFVLDESCTIETTDNYAGIIGSAWGANGPVCMENLGMEGTIRLGGYNGGGIIGNNQKSVATLHMKNCYVAGNVIAEGGYSGALTGWAGYNAVFENCWVIGQITGTDNEGAYFVRGMESGTITNCYSKIGTQAITITDEQVANGELCYFLNDNIENMVWYQTLGKDAHPVLDASHAVVYTTAEKSCDGNVIGEGEYTNDESLASVIPEHTFENGVCTVCGDVQEGFIEIDADGFYNISDSKQLVWFAAAVNNGEYGLNARLTADIDMTEFTGDQYMLNEYTGTFDGQEHSLTINIQTDDQQKTAFFRYTKGNATIRNLTIHGTIETGAKFAAGIVSQANDNTTIENCASYVQINSFAGGDCTHGGLIGYTQGSGTVRVNNCLFAGSINGESTNSCGGICGWSEVNTVMSNCLISGDFNIQPDGCATFARGSRTTIENCYYKEGFMEAGDFERGTKVSVEQLASGEVGLKLDANNTEHAWFQRIGEDESPSPIAERGVIYNVGKYYGNAFDNETLQAFITNVVSGETEYAKNVLAQTALAEEYEAAISNILVGNNIDEFMAAWKQIEPLYQSVIESEQAYTAYKANVDLVIADLEQNKELQNAKRDELEYYLKEAEEPSEKYANGTAPYILEERLLDTEGIKAETEKVTAMYNEVLLYSPTTGTQITQLLANYDFANGFDGWQGIVGTGYDNTGTASVRAAECHNATMDMYQTLTGLQNGLYEFSLNGVFIPAPEQDKNSTNYAAAFYANEVQNYFMTRIEDMVAADNAVDGENCNLTGENPDSEIRDEEDNLLGYVPNGIGGYGKAFQAGRYSNSVLCEVTDGTLTIGIRQPRGENQPEALGFGNIKLVYHGTAEEATDGLDRALASMSARANTLANTYMYSSGSDYKYYPNFSQALKDELNAAIKAVPTANNSEKLVLVKKFSELFQQVYECKLAYINLMNQIEELYIMSGSLSGILAAEQAAELSALIDNLVNMYSEGTVGIEDANKNYVEELSFLPEIVDNVVKIETAFDLTFFAAKVNDGESGLNAVLEADIDLSGIVGSSYMLNRFTGTFDGQGHTLTLDIKTDQQRAALFCHTSGNALIKDLILRGTIETSNKFAGGIVGQANDNTTIENCASYVQINSLLEGDCSHGGLIGYTQGSGTVRVNNCLFAGSINGANTNNCGGICGWSEVKTIISNCLLTGNLNIQTEGCATFSRYNMATIENCYYKEGFMESGDYERGVKVSVGQLASGEVCYLLNGDQSDICWYQVIGEDAHPVLDASHAVVYTTAEKRCDGKVVGEGNYTNDEKLSSVTPPHQYENDVCTVCGQFNLEFLDMKDGFYQIADASQLVRFMKAVNVGNIKFKAQLTADIDMSAESANFLPIGTETHMYSGVFDGQGHRIKNLNISLTQPRVGVFGVIQSPAVIKNFVLDESCTIETTDNYAGIIGSAWGANGPVCMENLGMEGTIRLGGYNGGGIIGNNQKSVATLHMKNCYVAGNVIAEGGYSGALTGWAGYNAVFENCWVIGQITGTDNEGAYFVRGMESGTITNCYSKIGTQAITITDEQVANGELCYKLNGDQSTIVWYQNIGEDLYPVLDSTHKTVVMNAGGNYENASGEGIQSPDFQIGIHDEIYDLSGRKVSKDKLSKGVYIINRKKFLINN